MKRSNCVGSEALMLPWNVPSATDALNFAPSIEPFGTQKPSECG
jgi:hypothetical protein